MTKLNKDALVQTKAALTQGLECIDNRIKAPNRAFNTLGTRAPVQNTSNDFKLGQPG